MAKTSDQLTVDYRTIMSIPPRDRRALLSSGSIDPLLGVLTPGQRVALFPDYFKQQINEMAGQRSAFGATSGSQTINAAENPGLVAAIPPTGGSPNNVPVRQVQSVQLSGAREKPGENSEFYDRAYQAVYKAAVERGVPNPEVIARLGAAQAAIETGYGKHQVGNNYFGIKGKGVKAATQEFRDGRMVSETAEFAAYGGLDDSAAGYVEFLQKNKRYAPLFAATSVDQAIAIQGTTGYATDPQYGAKLASINGNYGVNAPTATPVFAEVPNDVSLASVADDTVGIGKETATAIPERVMEAGGIESYTEMRNGVPVKIGIDDPIWQTVDPSLAKMRDRLVDADTGLINRDTLLAADASARVLRKNGYIPRPVSGGDNHSANHGEGRDANYAIDMAASIQDPETGQIRNIRAGSELPYEVKRDMAVAAMLSGSDENLRIGMPMSDSNASVHLQYDREKPEGFWGYDSRTAAGAEPQRAILETTPEGRRFLADMDAIRNLPKEKRDELFASVTGAPTEVASASPVPTSPSLTPPATTPAPANTTPQLASVGDDTKPIGVPTSSMAYGGVITEPHTAINNRTGERVNIGEVGTGGEAIVPMSKVRANEVGQQPYQMPVQAPAPDPRMPKQMEVDKKEPMPKNATGQSVPTTVAIAVDHQVVPPSARKAYADAGLEHRFNNFSSVGTQYRNFGL